jgi:hypothetical protein
VHPGEKWMLGIPAIDVMEAEGHIVGGRGVYGGWHCQYCFPLHYFALKVGYRVYYFVRCAVHFTIVCCVLDAIG